MSLDHEIAEAELAVRKQENVVRSKVEPFAMAIADEVAKYTMSEVRNLVINNYQDTEELGAETVAKLRSEVENAVAEFPARALELYTRNDQMIYAGLPQQEVVRNWGVANHEPLWVLGGLRELLEPVNRVLLEYYGPGSDLPQDEGMRQDAFSSPGRYPIAIRESLKDYRDERAALSDLQKKVDGLHVQVRKNAAANVWDASA